MPNNDKYAQPRYNGSFAIGALVIIALVVGIAIMLFSAGSEGALTSSSGVVVPTAPLPDSGDP